MAKCCDDCIHKDICRFEDSYNYILNATKRDLEDFPEVKDIFEVQLTCSKKTYKTAKTGSVVAGYSSASVYLEDQNGTYK